MPLLDTPVRLGLQLQPQHAAYSDIRDAVVRFEDMGVDILFNWDHFYPLHGDPDGAHFESWTMLAAGRVVHRGPLVEAGVAVTV